MHGANMKINQTSVCKQERFVQVRLKGAEPGRASASALSAMLQTWRGAVSSVKWRYYWGSAAVAV